MKTNLSLKMIGLASSMVLSAIAPTTVLASKHSTTCKGFAQGSILDEVYESTTAQLEFVSGARFLLTLSAEGETHVDKAICDLSTRATGLLHQSQYICVDEKGDSITALINGRENTLSLHSPYFPPKGKIDLKCK